MRCRLIGEYFHTTLTQTFANGHSRYEVANGNASWEDAEKQVARTKGRAATVSIKNGSKSEGKRKAGALEEAQKELAGGGGEKKAKKGKKGR